MERDYFFLNDESDVPIFGPGDLAYELFGIESGENDPAFGDADSVFDFIPSDQFFGSIGQAQALGHYWTDWVNPRLDGGSIIALGESGNNVGIRFEDGEWKSEIIVPLYLYDAGTDSGENSGSVLKRTAPQLFIGYYFVISILLTDTEAIHAVARRYRIPLLAGFTLQD